MEIINKSTLLNIFNETYDSSIYFYIITLQQSQLRIIWTKK